MSHVIDPMQNSQVKIESYLRQIRTARRTLEQSHDLSELSGFFSFSFIYKILLITVSHLSYKRGSRRLAVSILPNAM